MRNKKEIQPLDFLLSVMRNAKLSANIRIDAAKSALPYIHSKKPVSEIPVDPDAFDAVPTIEADEVDQFIKDFKDNF